MSFSKVLSTYVYIYLLSYSYQNPKDKNTKIVQRCSRKNHMIQTDRVISKTVSQVSSSFPFVLIIYEKCFKHGLAKLDLVLFFRQTCAYFF